VRQRVAIVLRYYEDLTETQTAAAMGCAVGTVKSAVFVGLGTLRRRLADEWPEGRTLLDLDEVTS
jgi:DNA-directed RNA polymerase specialized sigma24 family protein